MDGLLGDAGGVEAEGSELLCPTHPARSRTTVEAARAVDTVRSVVFWLIPPR
jgi:hypothetical protein